MPLSHPEANARLNALNVLNKELHDSVQLAQTGASTPVQAEAAIEKARQIKADLERGIKELSWELVLKMIVPDAINPCAEALKEAGLPDNHPECAEKHEVIFNLEELIKSHCDLYTAQGMTEWVKDIQTNYILLKDYLITQEEKDKIEKRIKCGLVPVLMPSRQVQVDTWRKASQKLKPIWIEDYTEKSVADPYLDVKYLEKMISSSNPDELTQPTFFDSIPNRPYLVWTKPTQEVDPATAGLTYDQQKDKLAALHTEEPDLVDATDLTPVEYVALQFIHSSTIRQIAEEYVSSIKKMIPLDKLDTTRFLSFGLLSDGKVSSACFGTGFSLLQFAGDVVDARLHRGFRPVARS